jgi:hypothetical protein
MSAIQKIAYYQGCRDEVPNQMLARELAQKRDLDGIREIADHLHDQEKNIRSDCLKVLYEIGYIEPSLIADYWLDFTALLPSKDNRMVWGAMIALAQIVDLRSHEIGKHMDEIIQVTGIGTVITKVWGIRVLAGIAADSKLSKPKVMPFMFNELRSCIPRDVPTHAASMLKAIGKDEREEFLSILEARQEEMTSAQLKKTRAIMKRIALEAK